MNDLAEIGALIQWLEEWAKPSHRDASLHKHERGWGVALLKMTTHGWQDYEIDSGLTIAVAIERVKVKAEKHG